MRARTEQARRHPAIASEEEEAPVLGSSARVAGFDIVREVRLRFEVLPIIGVVVGILFGTSVFSSRSRSPAS